MSFVAIIAVEQSAEQRPEYSPGPLPQEKGIAKISE